MTRRQEFKVADRFDKIRNPRSHVLTRRDVLTENNSNEFSPDSLVHLPYGERFELIDGEVVERSLDPNALLALGHLFLVLSTAATRIGAKVLQPNQGFQCFSFDENRVRRPHISVIVGSRLDQQELFPCHLEISPDFVVDFVGREEQYYAVEDRVADFLRAGTRNVWLINPGNHSARIFNETFDRSTQYGPKDELTAPGVLPGFRCRIGDFFDRNTARE